MRVQGDGEMEYLIKLLKRRQFESLAFKVEALNINTIFASINSIWSKYSEAMMMFYNVETLYTKVGVGATFQAKAIQPGREGDIQTILDQMQEANWITKVAEDTYRLTSLGYGVGARVEEIGAGTVISTFFRGISSIKPNDTKESLQQKVRDLVEEHKKERVRPFEQLSPEEKTKIAKSLGKKLVPKFKQLFKAVGLVLKKIKVYAPADSYPHIDFDLREPEPSSVAPYVMSWMAEAVPVSPKKGIEILGYTYVPRHIHQVFVGIASPEELEIVEDFLKNYQRTYMKIIHEKRAELRLIKFLQKHFGENLRGINVQRDLITVDVTDLKQEELTAFRSVNVEPVKGSRDFYRIEIPQEASVCSKLYEALSRTR